jgi:hypothetical protein
VPEIRLAADGVARFDRADIDELLLPAQAGP